jgi:ribosomal 50S subunit-associated protein YjgA (DUF615 family)
MPDYNSLQTDLNWIKDALSEIKCDVKAQNGRVRKLENWRWYLIGIFGGIVFVFEMMVRI